MVSRPVLGKSLRAAENVCREERLVAQAEEIGLIWEENRGDSWNFSHLGFRFLLSPGTKESLVIQLSLEG